MVSAHSGLRFLGFACGFAAGFGGLVGGFAAQVLRLPWRVGVLSNGKLNMAYGGEPANQVRQVE